MVAIAAFGLIFYNGIVDRPGEPSGEIELEFGWYGLMLGAILMMVGVGHALSPSPSAPQAARHHLDA